MSNGKFSVKHISNTEAVQIQNTKDDVFSKHPFIILFSVCMLCAVIFDQTAAGFITSNIPLLIISLAALGVIIYSFFNCKLKAKKLGAKTNSQLNTEYIITSLIVGGFLLRLIYILYTPVGDRQHDVFSFGATEPMVNFKYQRHAEYIEYICRYMKLPDVNPTETGLSQLYHPPLHHIIAALWLKLNIFLGTGYRRACESIQILTLFYSSSCMIICSRLFKKLNLKGLALYIPLAIICFHPTFILLSGSVNNDILCITLAIAAIYSTVRWYQKPSMKTIIPIAFFVGLSMMTKLSGALVAPAIAVVFLVKWISSSFKEKSCFKRYLIEFIVFAVICVPLGLWWPVRNAIKFSMPFNYVPSLTPLSGQYLGSYTVFQRLFEFQKESFSRIFVAWKDTYSSSFNEYNIFVSMLKNSVFGEYSLFYIENMSSTVLTLGTLFSNILFYSNALLIAFSLFSMVWAFVKRRWISNCTTTFFFAIIWAVTLVSFVSFCFKYPQTCTQDFRYAVPCLISGTVFIGNMLNTMFLRSRDSYIILRRSVIAVTAVFMLSSTLVYTLLAFVG